MTQPDNRRTTRTVVPVENTRPADNVDSQSASLSFPGVVFDASSPAGQPVRRTLAIPRQLGRYLLGQKLGQGAMAIVYSATDMALNREVAIKIPLIAPGAGGERRERFLREARVGAALQHRHICAVYDVGEANGIPFMAMALLPGGTLSRVALPQTLLPDVEVAAIVRKLATALQSAHDRGIVHRDLKPANILFDQDGEPVIADFGLARLLDADADARLTQPGVQIGSPAYMAPERLESATTDAGPLTDMFSLGIVLFELLTGELPFRGSAASVIARILSSPAPKPSSIKSSVSPTLERICLKMLARDPAGRYASMADVAEALHHFEQREQSFRSLPKTSAGSVPKAPAVTRVPDEVGGQTTTDRKAQVRRLVSNGDYGPALQMLRELAADTRSENSEAVWAGRMIPVLRRERDMVRDGRQSIYDTARSLIAAKDYQQAVALLSDFPIDLRSPRMQQLLEEAEQLAGEVEKLEHDLDLARRRGHNPAALKLARQLLEIKPQHKTARSVVNRLTGGRLFSAERVAAVVTDRGTEAHRVATKAVVWTVRVFAALVVVVLLNEVRIRRAFNQSGVAWNELVNQVDNGQREEVLVADVEAAFSGSFRKVLDQERLLLLRWNRFPGFGSYEMEFSKSPTGGLTLVRHDGNVPAESLNNVQFDQAVPMTAGVATEPVSFAAEVPGVATTEQIPDGIALTAFGRIGALFAYNVSSVPNLEDTQIEAVTQAAGGTVLNEPQFTSSTILWDVPKDLEEGSVQFELVLRNASGERSKHGLTVDCWSRFLPVVELRDDDILLSLPADLPLEGAKHDEYLSLRVKAVGSGCSRDELIQLADLVHASASIDSQRSWRHRRWEQARDVAALALKYSCDEEARRRLSEFFYDSACGQALSGNDEAASHDLDWAIRLGFDRASHLKRDADLTSLRSSSRWQCWINHADSLVGRRLSPTGLFDFELHGKDVMGREIDLTQMRGKVVLVDIFASWCAPCRDLAPRLETLRDKLAPLGFEVIGISDAGNRETEESIRKYVGDYGLSYPCGKGHDEVFRQVPDFGAFPTLLLIDRQGRVRWKAVGAPSTDELERLVKLLIDENVVMPPGSNSVASQQPPDSIKPVSAVD